MRACGVPAEDRCGTAARSIDVISPVFEGKSAVERQRMVYKAIWAELQATFAAPAWPLCGQHRHTFAPQALLLQNTASRAFVALKYSNMG